MIYFRCYIEDYDDATSDLAPLEDGMFFRLLRHYYRTELPLPLDSDRLARICRAIALDERAAIAAVLDRFFIRRPDGYHNERADHEIEVSKTARENGSRGGRPSAGTEARTGSETGSETGCETQPQTGEGTGTGQPVNQNNPSNLLTSQPSTQPPSADAARRGARKPSETGETWESYRQAYADRYGEDPVRNQRVNGQLASVVRCVGAAEAPAVAAFYVRHNRADYVKALHPASLMARDAESLRTAWAANRTVSDTEARQADRTMATGNAFAPLIEQARVKVAG
jgi:uncharacterized protein YdaU (DUF1376 family)